jgi:sialic acid synthase SpsE
MQLRILKKGNNLLKENIRSIRPGFGLEPKYYEQVLGKIAKCDIKRGTPTSFDLIL